MTNGSPLAFVFCLVIVHGLDAQSAVLRTVTDIVAEAGYLGSGARNTIPAGTTIATAASVSSANPNASTSVAITPASQLGFDLHATAYAWHMGWEP